MNARRHRTLRYLGASLLAVATLTICRARATQSPAPVLVTAPATSPVTAPVIPPTTQPFAAVPDQTHLENAHFVTEKLLSGAQPEGDESFRLLQAMGVKTIISVDGAKPDVERAKKFGLRYVHLPIGYDGVSEEQGQAIAKALIELPGPIYLHCHHGKHRSAAATAVACVYAGMLPPERAEDVLKTFGTGKNYTGLWAAARDARPLAPATLESLKVEYVEIAKIRESAAAMVEVDARWDHIKLLKANKWQLLSDHPDLDPPHEALQLEELLREMGRSDSSHAQIAEFRTLLSQSEDHVRTLRAALAAKPIDVKTADASFKSINDACTSCHKSFRD